MNDATSQTPAVSLVPAVRTASGNGTAIDIQGSEGRVAVVVALGAASGTTPTLDVTIEDSADGSTDWIAVSGAAGSQLTDADANSVQEFGFEARAARQYVRAVATIAGTTPSFASSVTIHRNPKVKS